MRLVRLWAGVAAVTAIGTDSLPHFGDIRAKSGA